jgi:hypothetical protein
MDQEMTQRLAGDLRRMLSTPPAAGTNDIVVAHSANLWEAARIWPEPEGAAYIFKPLADGRFEPIAVIPPDQWAAVLAGNNL